MRKISLTDPSLQTVLREFLMGPLKGAVNVHASREWNRDVTNIVFTSTNYVKREVSGLIEHKLGDNKHAWANAVEAWTRADLLALADQMQSVVDSIREHVR